VVDALWATDALAGTPVLQGMAAASAAYGVPIVGGHTNHRSARNGLAVAVLGRAQHLLTSFDARPGDRLVMAVDLRGAFEEPHPFWNAATKAPPARLRGDLALLPQIAEGELCIAAKDISMAGPIGTALMLLESSRVGAQIDLDALPRPPGVPLSRWLQTFPSFGFILSVPPRHVDAVCGAFAARDIAAAVVGDVTASPEVWLHQGAARQKLWDVAAERFIAPATEPAHA
jgi:selenophosphate synthetase-related protein